MRQFCSLGLTKGFSFEVDSTFTLSIRGFVSFKSLFAHHLLLSGVINFLLLKPGQALTLLSYLSAGLNAVGCSLWLDLLNKDTLIEQL